MVGRNKQFFSKEREAAWGKNRRSQKETRNSKRYNTTSRMFESPRNGGEVLSGEIIGCPFQKPRWASSSTWSRVIQTALHCVVCNGSRFVLVAAHRLVAFFGNSRFFRLDTDSSGVSRIFLKQFRHEAASSPQTPTSWWRMILIPPLGIGSPALTWVALQGAGSDVSCQRGSRGPHFPRQGESAPSHPATSTTRRKRGGEGHGLVYALHGSRGVRRSVGAAP